MSDSAKTAERSPGDAQSEYMRGGKGRKDEVGKSGIYPASSPDAPGDALIRTEAELVGHAGGPATSRKNRRAGKEGRSSGQK
jgi:hypothetical protein